MALKDVVDLAFHLGLLAQEPPRGIGDERRGIADLVDDHAVDNHLDALGGHAGDLELGFIQRQGQRPHRLQAGQHQAPLPVTILKSMPARVSSVPRVSPEMMRASLGSATFHISFVPPR